ncbi:MAG: RMD1 family protein [Alsobacter sp.]
MSSPLTTTSATQAPSSAPAQRLRIRAILLGDRIDTNGLERSDMIASAPFAFRIGETGFAALFRYGVAVLAGLSPIEEDDILRKLAPRVAGPVARLDDEVALMEVTPDKEDQVPPGGPIQVRDLSPERFLVVADALAKSVAMAHNERQVSAVFDVIDPLARDLARDGRVPVDRKSILKLIGEALLVDHRMSGRVAVEDKPDVLWDRSDLERLYARLEDEYELTERARTLARKIGVIQDTARALTDLIDAQRSVRLEATIVLLIVVEVIVTFYQLFMGLKH